MDHHDPGAAGPRRARRRHASARRGRGAVWLLAGGGATALGLAAALLAGGLGKSGGTRSPVDGGAEGPPSMIQADPTDGTSNTSGAAGGAASGSSSGSSSGGGATSVPGGPTSAPAPSAKSTATAAPSGTATTTPDASPTAEPSATASAGWGPGKPGKGRGGTKRPK
ncbi:hypothetical protein [Streptomyces sp. TLI_105]|uniref:hypothetical protein n=1 Tax=Streptomyces sp. TLI_105 TaxID=1881019 RepID=UPI0008964B0A|nr:hypothetical protein [Streptomyces sp. TLI_105]SEC61038.1 hypothetical protein SAMN05428939_2802 [Streptomyces sp. TLI_105]